MPNREAYAAEFNAGSQARIEGRPRLGCLYASGTKLWKYWNDGWWHVHHYWGRDSRWPFRILPAADDGLVVSGGKARAGDAR